MTASRPRARQAQQQKIGETLRRLNERLVADHVDDDSLQRLALLLEKAEPLVLGHPPRRREVRADQDSAYDYGSQQNLFTPVSGALNAVAPKVRYFREGETAVAEVFYSAAFEGGPGLVHGGFTAALFDELFGIVQAPKSTPSMTGKLQVQYRKPVPLKQPLRFEGWCESHKGRKSVLKGRLMLAGTQVILAEAEALFIDVDHALYQDFSRQRNAQLNAELSAEQ
ncbi:PaaI family thioesterase [Ferrimonas pelagia]|uniref:Acyl-coenzyme A thioesterase THEM4 n=1 Tax=Ferrimonas pelagia TaxID=1177826 RepID=A0ABP9ENJ2_9GAMM